jgi:hypothetical protein
MAVKLVPGQNDLATTHRELSQQWAADLNGGLSPSHLTAGSGREVWWRCEKSHTWRSRPATRSKGIGCPFCANQRAWPGYNDLKSLFPEIALDWDSDLNSDTSPSDVVAGSNKKYWWVCSREHRFEASVSNRTLRKQGCPFCSSNRVLAGFNDLATTKPELAAQWSIRNSPIKASDVLPGSNKKYWWKCSNNHEWEQSPNVRSAGNNCPICSHQQLLPGYNDLATTNPDLAKFWDSEKNGASASAFAANARITAWWTCEEGHSWQANLRGMRNGQCPFCSNRSLLEGFNDLATKSPNLASQWNFMRNGNLKPNQVIFTSRSAAYWWTCEVGHEWKASLASRNLGNGCPVCSKQLISPGVNDMATTHPGIAASFHPTKNADILPSGIAAGTAKQFWWICELGHEWKTSANSRYNGSGCPYCTNVKFLSGFNDLETRSPQLVKQWNYQRNGSLTPSQVKFTSRASAYWWICEMGHEWKASLASRNNGAGCPSCAEFGFKPNKPAIFYFIENISLRARKVGITNLEDRAVRLSRFHLQGWKDIMLIQDDSGAKIRELEKLAIKWIRKEKMMPRYLSAEEMGINGGWTETFSIDGVSNREVISQLELYCAKLGIDKTKK